MNLTSQHEGELDAPMFLLLEPGFFTMSGVLFLLCSTDTIMKTRVGETKRNAVVC